MSRILVFLAVLFMSTLSIAELSYEQLNKVAITPEHLQGHFRQQKYLLDLDVTLHSSGKFQYQRDEAIRWETIEPIQNVLIMTPQRIVNSQGDNELVTLDAKSNPAVLILSDIFFSVLTADWKKLATYFSLTGTLEQQQWQVELIPTDAIVAQVMTRVELKGDGLLRELTFHEKNGDSTVITFDNLK